jgi:hypothetical protein
MKLLRPGMKRLKILINLTVKKFKLPNSSRCSYHNSTRWQNDEIRYISFSNKNTNLSYTKTFSNTLEFVAVKYTNRKN